VTKQLGSDGLGVWEVLGSDKPEPIRSFSGFAPSWVCAFARASAWILRARQRIAAVHRVVARRSAKTDTCLGRHRVRTLRARQNETKLYALEKRAVSGSDEGGSDEAKNHFPSLPARANQETGFIPTPRLYGRGSDLEVILEVIGSADRLPFRYRIAV